MYPGLRLPLALPRCGWLNRRQTLSLWWWSPSRSSGTADSSWTLFVAQSEPSVAVLVQRYGSIVHVRTRMSPSDGGHHLLDRVSIFPRTGWTSVSCDGVPSSLPEPRPSNASARRAALHPKTSHSCFPFLRKGSCWAARTSAAVSAARGLVAVGPVPRGCQSGAAVGRREDAQGSSVAWTPDGGHWSGM